MSSIKLFGLRGSTCTRRVLAVLEETGLPYEFYRVDWDGLEHKSADWIATKQPFGRIPVLRDGDYQIYESRAIARYLASAYDKTDTLYPSNPKIRGKIEQWISVEQSYYVAAEDLVVQVIFTPMKGGVPEQAKVQDAETRLHHALSIIDNHLASSQFFVGDNFTVAGKIQKQMKLFQFY